MKITKFQLRFFPTLIIILSIGLLTACGKNSSGSDGENDRHLVNSINYGNQGQYRAAILEARNSLAKHASAKAALHLADLYIKIGQARNAIQLLEGIENKNDALRIKLAEAYVEAQKYASAEKILGDVANESRTRVDYLVNAANAAGGLGKRELSSSLFDQVLAADPKNEKAHIGKFILAAQARDDKTLSAISEKIKTDFPTSARSLLMLARLEFGKGNFAEAENLLMTAIHNSKETDVMLPEKSAILQLLIETLTQQGRFADAVPFNKLLSEANPGHQEAQQALKNIVEQIQLGEWETVENLLAQFKIDHPNSAAAEPLLGLISLQKGNFEDANAILDNAVDPETASPLLVGASVLSKLKSNEKLEAFAILEEALSTKADNPKLLAIYGALATEMDDKKIEGENSLLKAIELDPNSPRVYGTLADFYFREGRIDEAKDTLLKAYEFNPEIPKLQYAIVRTLLGNNLESDAKLFADKLASSAPNKSSTWTSNALISIYKKDFKQAEKQLDKSLSIDKQNYAAWILSAATQLKMDNKNKALSVLEEASETFPEDSKLIAQSAQLYLSTDNLEKAKISAEKLRVLGDESSANYITANLLHKEGKTSEAYDVLVTEWDQRPNNRTALALIRYSGQIKKTPSGCQEKDRTQVWKSPDA